MIRILIPKKKPINCYLHEIEIIGELKIYFNIIFLFIVLLTNYATNFIYLFLKNLCLPIKFMAVFF